LVLDRWPHDAGSLSILRYSSNFVFTYREDGERRILRVADDRERGRAMILAETELLVWLADQGINLAPPLPSRAGNLVETLDAGDGVYHGVAYPALAGAQLDIDDLGLAQFAAWGAALGRLHAALRRYDAPSRRHRRSWRDDLALIAEHVPGGGPALRREADAIAAGLGVLPLSPETYGLIHYDFELDNLIWRASGVACIDFDDAAHHWYAADVAFALRDLFDHDVDRADPRVQSFLAGYSDHVPIGDEMLAALPLFSRLARLTTYARISRSLDVPPDEDAPDWVRDLQDRLENRRQRYLARLADGRS
jgi:Ser/Thr protein kinase RdoA (MazF antagonist)